jgi:hypothetical protein
MAAIGLDGLHYMNQWIPEHGMRQSRRLSMHHTIAAFYAEKENKYINK